MTPTTKDDLLVGVTGFVGSNLVRQHAFRKTVHAPNVSDVYKMQPSLCVYAGVPSAMFLANDEPDADLAVMKKARENLQRIAPRKVVLISTIAVFADSRGKDETASMTMEGLPPYGANRLQLENWVREDFDDALVVRLPALYGEGLKKNFIRDMIALAPPLLTDSKYNELAKTSKLIAASYENLHNGFFAQKPHVDTAALRNWFAHSDFNALSFTDSRSRFQFYGLNRLWSDINISLEESRTTFNLATPPVSAAEVYRFVYGRSWINELDKEPFDYDMRTKYADSGYLCSRKEELSFLKTFVKEQS